MIRSFAILFSLSGGLSFIGHKLEDSYSKNDDDLDDLNHHNLYIDANSLYSVGLLSALPTGNYRYLTPDEIKAFNMDTSTWDLEGPTGFTFIIDASYPPDLDLHRYHSDFPMLLQKRSVNFDDYSDYTKDLLKKLGIDTSSQAWQSQERLIADFEPKVVLLFEKENSV